MDIRRAFSLAFLITVASITSSFANAATINGISIASTQGFYDKWQPVSSANYPFFPEPLYPTRFFTSDGGTAFVGAGSSFVGHLSMSKGQVVGNTVMFQLTPLLSEGVDPAGAYTAFAYATGVGVGGGPNDFSQAVLDFTGPLTLTAKLGSNVATVSSEVKYVSPVWYSADSYLAQGGLTAQVGDLLPFSLTFTLSNTTWQPGIFDSSFSYSTIGTIGNVPASAPEPRAAFLLFSGLTLLICARARFGNCKFLAGA